MTICNPWPEPAFGSLSIAMRIARHSSGSIRMVLSPLHFFVHHKYPHRFGEILRLQLVCVIPSLSKELDAGRFGDMDHGAAERIRETQRLVKKPQFPRSSLLPGMGDDFSGHDAGNGVSHRFIVNTAVISHVTVKGNRFRGRVLS